MSSVSESRTDSAPSNGAPSNSEQLNRGMKREREEDSLPEPQFVEGDIDDDDDDDGGGAKDSKRAGRRKIKIEYIQDKSRRHITFSKRKAGIMKKAYELSTLTGTQVLLLVVSETGLVYTFTTPKLQPLVTKQEGKNLIQACLNAPDSSHNTDNGSPNRQPGQPCQQGPSPSNPPYPGVEGMEGGHEQYDNRKDMMRQPQPIQNMQNPQFAAANAAGNNYASLANLQYSTSYNSAALAAGSLNPVTGGYNIPPQGYPQYGAAQHVYKKM